MPKGIPSATFSGLTRVPGDAKEHLCGHGVMLTGAAQAAPPQSTGTTQCHPLVQWVSARAAPQKLSAITKGANWERN